MFKGEWHIPLNISQLSFDINKRLAYDPIWYWVIPKYIPLYPHLLTLLHVAIVSQWNDVLMISQYNFKNQLMISHEILIHTWFFPANYSHDIPWYPIYPQQLNQDPLMNPFRSSWFSCWVPTHRAIWHSTSRQWWPGGTMNRGWVRLAKMGRLLRWISMIQAPNVGFQFFDVTKKCEFTGEIGASTRHLITSEASRTIVPFDLEQYTSSIPVGGRGRSKIIKHFKLVTHHITDSYFVYLI